MIKDYFAPSKEQGEVIGIPLHDDWGIKNHSELQRLILFDEFNERLDSQIINDLWNQLSMQHPKLKLLNLWSDSKYHIVLGCVSQFNYDDIEYFLMVDTKDRPEKLDSRADALRNRFGYGSFQWVPSEKTLDKIESALMAKAA